MTIRHRCTPPQDEDQLPLWTDPEPVNPTSLKQWWRHNVAYLWDDSFIPDDKRWTGEQIAVRITLVIIIYYIMERLQHA